MTHELCEQELREVLLPYRRRATELIASVHHLVERLFDMPFEPKQQEITLANAEQPYWRTHKWKFAGLGSIPESWIDRMFPRRLHHARIRRRIMEQVEYLVTRNIGDLRWSTLQNLEKSVQTFRDTLNEGIQQATETTPLLTPPPGLVRLPESPDETARDLAAIAVMPGTTEIARRYITL